MQDKKRRGLVCTVAQASVSLLRFQQKKQQQFFLLVNVEYCWRPFRSGAVPIRCRCWVWTIRHINNRSISFWKVIIGKKHYICQHLTLITQKTKWVKISPDQTSSLIWIQTVWPSLESLYFENLQTTITLRQLKTLGARIRPCSTSMLVWFQTFKHSDML